MNASLFAIMGLLLVITLPAQAVVYQPAVAELATNEKPKTKIDLNTADIKTLSKAFKGIGKKRAEAIIKYRKSNGGFKSIEDLSQVRGLGEHFVKSHLTQLQKVFRVS